MRRAWQEPLDEPGLLQMRHVRPRERVEQTVEPFKVWTEKTLFVMEEWARGVCARMWLVAYW